MGQKLLKYYELVEQAGGVTAKMRFTMKTAIPQAKAGDAPDSPENLAKFHEAAVEIVGPSVPKL